MRFTPNYTVSYHGEFYKAGVPFDIEDKDIEEMSKHGIVSEGVATQTEPEEIFAERQDNNLIDETLEIEEHPRRGRPRKDG